MLGLGVLEGVGVADADGVAVAVGVVEGLEVGSGAGGRVVTHAVSVAATTTAARRWEARSFMQ